MKMLKAVFVLMLALVLTLALVGCGGNGAETDTGIDTNAPAVEEAKEVEHDERFMFAEFTVENIRTKIADNELVLKFEWINQSGKDMSPFTALGYIDVMQGDEILREQSDNPQTHDRNANGGFLPVTLKYELVNNEPIKILFGATHEYDDSTEELIIKVN